MSLFTTLWGAATSIVGLFKNKPTWGDAVPVVLTQIFPLVDQAIAFSGSDSKEKIDSMLEGFDVATGSEPGAVAVFSGIPRDKAEEFWDHIKEAVRIYAYNKVGLPGYVAE